MRILRLMLVVPALHGAGCRKDTTQNVDPPGASPAVAAPVPVDHLVPGELIEGKARAFALVLPRDVTIDNSFRDEVLAHGDATPEAVANYVRARVREGTITVGAMGTTFEHVRVPAEPTRELRIKVSAGRGSRSAIEIRDITPPVVHDPGNETDRWKQTGLLPNGKLLDPLHTQ